MFKLLSSKSSKDAISLNVTITIYLCCKLVGFKKKLMHFGKDGIFILLVRYDVLEIYILALKVN